MVLLVSLETLWFISLLPGSEAAALAGQQDQQPAVINAITKEFHLNEGFFAQYSHWITNLATGNLGRSPLTQVTVVSALKQRIPVTFELAFLALIVALLIAVPVAVYASYRQGKLVDKCAMAISSAFLSIPPFLRRHPPHLPLRRHVQDPPGLRMGADNPKPRAEPAARRAASSGVGSSSGGDLHSLAAKRHGSNLAGGLHPRCEDTRHREPKGSLRTRPAPVGRLARDGRRAVVWLSCSGGRSSSRTSSLSPGWGPSRSSRSSNATTSPCEASWSWPPLPTWSSTLRSTSCIRCSTRGPVGERRVDSL